MSQPVAVAITRWEVAADGTLRVLLQSVPLALEAEWWRVRSDEGWGWRRPSSPAASSPALDAAAAAALAALAEKPANPADQLLDQLVGEHPVLARIADQFGLDAPRR